MSGDYNRRTMDSGFLPSQSPIKDDLQQLYARNASQTEEIIETLRGVNDTQLMILSELQTLEHLSTRSDAATEVLDLARLHLEKMAKIIYLSNGYNEKGDKVPEGVLRFERWTNFFLRAFWNFIIIGAISSFFYFYTEGQKATRLEQSKAEIEILQQMEERLAKREQKITDLLDHKLQKNETRK